MFEGSSARSSGARAAAQAGAAQVGPTDQAGGQVPPAEAPAPGDSSQVQFVGGLAAPLDAAWSQGTLFCLVFSAHTFGFGVVVHAPGQSEDDTPLLLARCESCLSMGNTPSACTDGWLPVGLAACAPCCIGPAHWSVMLLPCMRCDAASSRKRERLLKAAASSLDPRASALPCRPLQPNATRRGRQLRTPPGMPHRRTLQWTLMQVSTFGASIQSLQQGAVHPRRACHSAMAAPAAPHSERACAA